MLNFLFLLLFCCLQNVISQNYDCYPSTTTITPASNFDCKRDIVIAIDGTPFMGNETNVLKEIHFVENMLKNWTFGDNGVNVAFIFYGFDGRMAYTKFIDNYQGCYDTLEMQTHFLTPNLQNTSLNSVIRNVINTYGDQDSTYPPRYGIEPRLIAFTSTTDLNDINNAKNSFDKLYNLNYDTILGIIYANVNFFSQIQTLKTLPMQNFDPTFFNNITETIETSLCVHDNRLTPSPCPSTSTSTTPKPTTTTTPILQTTTTTSNNGGGTGPSSGKLTQCDCHTENLWLDVIVVIDASKSITKEGLDNLKAHITTVFGAYTTISQTIDRSIRLGIISMTDDSVVIADLNTIHDRNDLITYLSNVKYEPTKIGANIVGAFQKASDLLYTQGLTRNNTKKVVILYTSVFTIDGVNDPTPISDQLKGDGVTIIGVQYIQEFEATFMDKLNLITSPNMTFSNNVTLNFENKQLLNLTLDALCYVNCFCINLWNQRKNDFTVYPDTVECFYMSDIDAGWEPARLSCEFMINGSIIAPVKTKEKYDYLVDLLTNLPTMNERLRMHLGVYYNTTIRNYVYLDGSVMKPSDYMPWDATYPDIGKGICVDAVQSSASSVKLRNVDCYTSYGRYPCQLGPCDTENYCPTLDL